MKKKPIAIGIAGVIALAAVVVVAVPGVSAATPAACPSSAESSLGSSSAGNSLESDAATRAYWTPERMASATSVDGASVPASVKSVSPGGQAGPVPLSAQDRGDYDRRSVGRIFVKLSNRIHPDRVINQSASAVTIEGGNHKNLAATSAHSVVVSGYYVVSIFYVPDYDNNNTPYGDFSAATWRVSTHYRAVSLEHDVAFLIFRPNCDGNNVRNIGDFAEMNLIRFNHSPDQIVTMVGYGGSATNRQSQAAWYGRPARRDATNHSDISVDADVFPGASGGPIFADSTPGLPTPHWDMVIGVISGSQGGRTVGPLLDSNDIPAYNAAIDVS